jgi:LRR receptor-like serine/threonine-protein kinase FLS2
LDGTIPAENGKLTSLFSVSLTNNDKLVGTIPTALCDLVNLRGLELNGNQLTGSIPSCLGELTSMEKLDMSRNLLESHIPEQLCQLSSMNELFIGSNNLSGDIPTCLGSMLSLTQLVMNQNKFNGTIPDELCTLFNLLSLNLARNTLTGEIPSCFGSFPFLQGLDISDNVLMGTLPNELSNLNNSLEILSIDGNALYGDPTDVFNRLFRLRILLASNNEFVFTINSTFLSDTILLKHFDISHNNMVDGTFPVHLLNYPNLNTLDVSSNHLIGEFTDEISLNGFLQVLSVYNNKMTGPVTSLVNLSELIFIDLSKNQFTGPMEPIGELKSLRNIFLSENPFETGPIPQSFGTLYLEELSLRNTNRIGTLLDPLGNWGSMKFLDFSSNNLEGNIPSSYSNLIELYYLLLNNNTFITGDLPSGFEQMTKLLGILLDGTSITVPTAVQLICSLPNFENNITGQEILIVDCTGECTTACTGCQCCDPNVNTGCSKPFLGNFDVALDFFFRRSYDYYNITDGITSTFEDNI